MKKSELVRLLDLVDNDTEIELYHQEYCGDILECQDNFDVLLHQSLNLLVLSPVGYTDRNIEYNFLFKLSDFAD